MARGRGGATLRARAMAAADAEVRSGAAGRRRGRRAWSRRVRSRRAAWACGRGRGRRDGGGRAGPRLPAAAAVAAPQAEAGPRPPASGPRRAGRALCRRRAGGGGRAGGARGEGRPGASARPPPRARGLGREPRGRGGGQKGKWGEPANFAARAEARPCAPGASPAPADLSLCSEEGGTGATEKLAGRRAPPRQCRRPWRLSPARARGAACPDGLRTGKVAVSSPAPCSPRSC